MEVLSSYSKWILSSFLKLSEKLIFSIHDIKFMYYCLNNAALQPLCHYTVLNHDKKRLQISFKPNHKFLLIRMHFYTSTLIRFRRLLEKHMKVILLKKPILLYKLLQHELQDAFYAHREKKMLLCYKKLLADDPKLFCTFETWTIFSKYYWIC